MGDGYRRGTLWIYDLSTKKYICKWDKDFAFPPTDRLVSVPLRFTTAESETPCDNELVESESLNEFLNNFRIKE